MSSTGLTAPCAAPTALPAQKLSAGAVERLWGRDRVALTTCGDRLAATAEIYRQRDAGLAGTASTASQRQP